MKSTNEPDDLAQLLAKVEEDPVAKASFEDARARRELLLEMVQARGKMRQAIVADAMGTTQSAISDLERGRVDPRLSTLQRYARAVGRRLEIDMAEDHVVSTSSEFVGSAVEVATDYSVAAVLSSLFKEQKVTGAQTRRALVDLTGLPEPTVRYIVSQLEENGWVSSSSDAPTDIAHFAVRENRGFAIGVSLTRGRAQAVLTDLSATTVVASRHRVLTTGAPDDVVTTVTALVEELREVSDEIGQPHDVVGLGVTLAGLVDGATGAVYFAPDLDSLTTPWRQVPLEALIEERTQLRTAVENDANALAMHEFLAGGAEAGLVVIMMSLSGDGIGSGLVINGETAHGLGGIAGEIGHLVIDPAGEPCRCRPGARGCLETVASPAAILRRSAVEGSPAPGTLADLAKLVNAGDAAAIAAVQTAGAALAYVIAHIISMVGPRRIVLFGPPELVNEESRTGRILVAGARKSQFVPAFDVKVDIDPKVLDGLTEAKAAAAAALHHFLSRPRRWVPNIAGPSEHLVEATVRYLAAG